MGFFTGGHNSELEFRMKRIERRLDAIMAQLGMTVPDDGMDDVRDLIAAGKKINAIKLYRQKTGLGLLEAKQAVDSGLL